jgi:hypothetical protein
LTGSPLGTLLRRDTYRDLALKATDWLTDLATQQTLQPRAAWWERLVESVLKDFERTFGRVVDPGLLAKTWSVLAGLGELPQICEHRDFSPWNVQISAEGSVVVHDWESAEIHGLPAMDLLYFLTYAAFFIEGIPVQRDVDLRQVRRAYRDSLDPATFAGSVRQECLARYTKQVGLDPVELPALSLLVWLIHSRSEYRHFMADSAEKPDDTALRRSLFVSLWEEELRQHSE